MATGQRMHLRHKRTALHRDLLMEPKNPLRLDRCARVSAHVRGREHRGAHDILVSKEQETDSGKKRLSAHARARKRLPRQKRATTNLSSGFSTTTSKDVRARASHPQVHVRATIQVQGSMPTRWVYPHHMHTAAETMSPKGRGKLGPCSTATVRRGSRERPGAQKHDRHMRATCNAEHRGARAWP